MALREGARRRVHFMLIGSPPTFEGEWLRALALGGCLLALAGCGDAYRYLTSGEVGWNLKKEIRDNNAKEVNLAQLARFEWDELFLFGPYQSTESICAQLGLNRAACKSKVTTDSPGEGEILLVFRHENRIVHVETHSRFHGDFTPIGTGKPLTRDSAIFVVVADGLAAGGEPWLKLRPKSLVNVP